MYQFVYEQHIYLVQVLQNKITDDTYMLPRNASVASSKVNTFIQRDQTRIIY